MHIKISHHQSDVLITVNDLMNLKKQQQIQQIRYHMIGHTDLLDLNGHRLDPVCLDDAFSNAKLLQSKN